MRIAIIIGKVLHGSTIPAYVCHISSSILGREAFINYFHYLGTFAVYLGHFYFCDKMGHLFIE